MNRLKLAIAGTLLLIVLILIVQNTEVVGVTLLFWEVQMSRVILILVTTLIGFVSGYVVARVTASRPKDV